MVSGGRKKGLGSIARSDGRRFRVNAPSVNGYSMYLGYVDTVREGERLLAAWWCVQAVAALAALGGECVARSA